jgi:hypothetical protein
VTVDPAGYEGRLDPGLLSLVPPGLRVIRCPAWPVRWTRPLGIGDLGLRAYVPMRRACTDLLERERFDALFITIYPTYPALLGPGLKRRFGLRFVLDYQDPWVGAWGDTVGGGVDGQADWKSRATRRLAGWLEPRAVQAADAITAVSSGTFQSVVDRYGASAPADCAVLPIGGEPADFEILRHMSVNNPYFDRNDGLCHVSYVGTLLPLGAETLSAVLEAVALLKGRRADLYARLRLHFFGTSNQTAGEPVGRVKPIAESIGVADCVSEVPVRVPYLDALRIQLDSHVLLLLGSSERHYTASKLYPALLAKRPLLAVYHEASSVVVTLNRVGRPPSVRLIVFDDRGAVESIERIYEALVSVVSMPQYDSAAVDLEALDEYSARAVAGQLVAVLNRVVAAAS